jgi:Rod binding domain-containing protein
METISSSSNMGLSMQSQIEQLQRKTQPEQVKYAAQQFESVFLRQILGDAMKPMFKGCLDEDGADNNIYRSMVVDSLADSMSKADCFGFSSLIQAQLQPTGGTQEGENNNE